MKKNKILSLVLLCLSVFFCAGCSVIHSPSPEESTSLSDVSVTDHSLMVLEMAGKKIVVEAVNTPESLTKGLGERDQIGSEGMLFFLPKKDVARFWMHGMKFPLDMVWIDGNTVVGIEKDVAAPADPSSINLPSYSSKVPVTHVLELPAGMASQLGLEVGNTIMVEPAN